LSEHFQTPIGFAPDIARQVKIRKAKRKPAPDNLSPETQGSSV